MQVSTHVRTRLHAIAQSMKSRHAWVVHAAACASQQPPLPVSAVRHAVHVPLPPSTHADWSSAGMHTPSSPLGIGGGCAQIVLAGQSAGTPRRQPRRQTLTL
jgi:hypothetical protein